jgi:hypothetical protein
MPPKINLPGLKLRKKSKIHADIIDKTTGRRKTDVTWGVERELKNIRSEGRENWVSNGSKPAIGGLEHSVILADAKQINKLYSKTNTKINIMFIGPGAGGGDILLFTEKLKNNFSSIDTFALSNSLLPEVKNIVNEYAPNPETISNKDVFEHFNHLKFTNKYNYIYSFFGPDLHTNHYELVVLKVASMLKPGGFARIGWFTRHSKALLNINKYLKANNLRGKILLRSGNKEIDWLLIKRLK